MPPEFFLFCLGGVWVCGWGYLCGDRGKEEVWDVEQSEGELGSGDGRANKIWNLKQNN